MGIMFVGLCIVALVGSCQGRDIKEFGKSDVKFGTRVGIGTWNKVFWGPNVRQQSTATHSADGSVSAAASCTDYQRGGVCEASVRGGFDGGSGHRFATLAASADGQVGPAGIRYKAEGSASLHHFGDRFGTVDLAEVSAKGKLGIGLAGVAAKADVRLTAV